MTPATRIERRQVPLYIAAIVFGGVFAVLAPGAASATTPAITPVLGLLLFATFLGVPFASLGRGLRGGRFVGTLLAVNFVAAPIVAFALTRFLTADAGILVGALIVLLAPCIDYVVVFTGIAGGGRERLLAATPLLMVTQAALLPLYLWLMAGPDVAAAIDPGPFVEAFVILIAIPLALALLVQLLARRLRPLERLRDAAGPISVPLLMLTLAIVVASQLPAILGRPDDVGAILTAVPVFAAFAVVMAIVGAAASRIARLGRADGRAILFSGVTRNSLVVLPLVLALPPAYAAAPLVVVTQTLVELVAMVVLVAVFRRRLARAGTTG